MHSFLIPLMDTGFLFKCVEFVGAVTDWGWKPYNLIFSWFGELDVSGLLPLIQAILPCSHEVFSLCPSLWLES